MPTNFNRYERCLNDIEWISQSVRSAFSDAAFNTRSINSGSTIHEQTIWNTSANVIGPLYTAFVWWILKKAEAQGIKRLYFMARDGLILKEIADILVPAGGFNVENRYFYVSRESLLYPSIVNLDTFDLRWILWPIFKSMTVAQLLKRIKIEKDEIKDILAKYHFSETDKKLGLKEKLRFRNLIKDPVVQKLIQEQAATKYKTAIAYLKQEGLGDGTPFAVVDLGWLALSQYAISRMLDTAGIRPAKGIQGYYLGTNYLLWKYKNDAADALLFNSKNMYRRIKLVQYELPEIFATSLQGRTLGYTLKDGISQPELGDINYKAKEWGSEKQKESVLAFANRIAATLSKNQWRENSPDAKIGKIFELFCNAPSAAEAETYGKFVHGADIEEKDGHEIAPVIRINDLSALFTGYYWVQGSIHRSKLFPKTLYIYLFTIINIIRHAMLSVADLKFPRRS